MSRESGSLLKVTDSLKFWGEHSFRSDDRQFQLNQQHKDLSHNCFISANALDVLGIKTGECIALSLSEAHHRSGKDFIFTAIGCSQLKNDKTDVIDVACILLSPVSLHKMGIYTRFELEKTLNIWISSPGSTIYRTISSVTLSRIAGYQYPESNLEKEALKTFFSKPKQIAPGDIVCVSTLDLVSQGKPPLSVFENEFCKQISDVLFMYSITGVVTDISANIASSSSRSRNNSNNSNEYNKSRSNSHNENGKHKIPNCNDFTVARSICGISNYDANQLTITVTVQDITRIILNGKTNCRVPDKKALADYCFMVQKVFDMASFEKQDEPQRNLLGPSIEDLFKTLLALTQLASTESVDKGNTGNELSKGHIYQHSIADNTFYGLITSPLLLECANGEHDMRAISLGAAQKLGISVVTIDARILERYSSSRSVNAPFDFEESYLSLLPFQLQDSVHPGICNTVEGSVIVTTFAPCILLLENMDSLIFEDTGDQAQASNSEENEPQEQFALILKTFFSDLWSAVSNAAKAKSETAFEENNGNKMIRFREELINSMVLVVTATQSISRLKPALRALFPSELVCNTFSDAKVQEYMDSIFTAVISDDRNVNDDDNIVNKDLNNDNSYGKSDSDDESKGLNDNLLSKQSISQDLVSVKNKINGDNQKVQKKILEVASQMSGDGGKGVTKLILKEVVDETITRSLQRLSGASWLKECGLSNGKPKGLSNGVDSSFSSLVLSPIDGISLVEKDVNRAALSLSRSHVRTGGVGASNSSGGEGGAKVSPVHWEDIGGLDRVRKEILDILQLPSLRPELFPAGSSMRRGISLYGPSGLNPKP